MDECFKRVEVIVAAVPDPVASAEHRTEIRRAVVHGLTVEAEETAVG